MPNVNRPQGLRPICHLNGTPYNGQVKMYLFVTGDGTATFIGDPVKLAGSAGTAGLTVNGYNVEGMPTIAQSAAGDDSVGVVVGFLPLQTNLETRHRVASTARIALVAGVDVLYEVQEIGTGTPLTADEVGLNANLVIGSGNATTGVSACMLDNSQENTTSSFDVQIMGLVPRVDNAFGQYAKYLVRLNATQYHAGTTGV